MASALRQITSAGAGPIALRALLIAAMLALPVVASKIAAVTQLDDGLIAKRFEWAPRDASGKIVFIAIDKRTLDAVGIWPWPRSQYGKLLEKLTAANAADIFLDIDFSTPSSPAEDGALAAALEKAGGGVLLPIFRQKVAAGSSETEISKPIAALLANAWPVFANVPMDADGIIRGFDLGNEFDGRSTQSAAAALSGSPDTSGRRLIDFSIRQASVPTYSLVDVLSGKVADEQLEGRSIVVGASAAELKDIFPVPLEGSIVGPLLHVLAAETLLQNRSLRQYDQEPIELLVAAILIVAIFSSRMAGMAKISLLLLAMGLVGEAVAFCLQKDFAVVSGTTVFWMLLALAWVLALNERIDLRQMMATFASIDARNTRRLMRRIIADSSDGIVAFTSDMKIADISVSAKAVLRLDAGADLLTSPERSVTEAVASLMARFDVDSGRIHTDVVEFVTYGGEDQIAYEARITLSPVEGHDPKAAHSFCGCIIIRDVTVQKRYQAKLKRMSEEDDLTGLLNRREFLARLEGRNGLVVVLEIERFSDICAAIGRDAGDTLLRAVGARLGVCVLGGPLGRIDGALFAVVTTEDDDPALYAERLLNLFDEPVAIDGTPLIIAVRLGFAHAGPLGAEGALRAAESALDTAKKTSEAWAIYNPAIALRQARLRRLEADIRAGLRDQQFFLLYQPQVDLSSGRFVGAEALLRWRHPELGVISPAEFIPIAESSGLICDIGRWVLTEACAEASRWPFGTVSVNMSPVQFDRSDVEAEVRFALSTSGLPPSRLCLELTESVFLGDRGRSIEKMAAARAIGVSLALDDFGTGYSSMSYLADLPLDKLKIDQSFVRRMTGAQGVLEIVKAIVFLARGLNLEIVAEGVEGEGEKALLRQLECQTGQGYLFGKPQLASEMIAHFRLSMHVAGRAPRCFKKTGGAKSLIR
ncbi:putative signal transduction protein with EAL and GGDEF domain/CHASE2 domain-containing sensor protein [Rhizobium leguminosarum]|uniref:Putative signal transduction protein with EAL and GGDEF domain/CHASE2 domain-containing sensor protein n=1 Tax=Rhizobium leguminosarum TaxID=384 RepID=A0A7W9ZMP6_RHILE|nr:putative signal transduction protein with EAL and GGDEF domain/CHASE2 domain-containing sensor protein [Rhizobium leguminosarum]